MNCKVKWKSALLKEDFPSTGGKDRVSVFPREWNKVQKKGFFNVGKFPFISCLIFTSCGGGIRDEEE